MTRRSLLLGLLAAAPLRAQYLVDRFTTGSGLPQTTVGALAQTPDGYLWIGTFDGLVRFDGVTFTTFDRGNTPTMRRTQFQRMFVSADGALWAGTDRGVLRVRGDRFEWREPDSAVRAARRPADARAYAAFVPRDTVEPPTAPAATHPPGTLAPRWAGRDRRGDAWYFTATALWRVRADSVTRFRSDSLFGTQLIRYALADRDGALWVGTEDRGLFRIVPSFLRVWGLEGGLLQANVYPVLQDAGGRIWAGSGRGVTVRDGARVSRFAFRRYDSTRVEVFADPTPARLLDRSTATVGALLAGADGSVWVGIGDAILAFDGRRVTRFVPLPDAGVPTALWRDRAGAMWVASADGLVRWDGRQRARFDTTAGLPSRSVTAVHEDAAGTLWVGTTAGLARREGARFVAEPALAGEQVRVIADASGGGLWVGTFDNGLRRYRDGRAVAITTDHGLPSNGVFAVLDDGRGALWMSSNQGITRVARAQVEAVADGRARRVRAVLYGSADGMRSPEANGGRHPAGLVARDGTLWFPTQDGVVIVDPAAVPTAPAPPQVVIERVIVDGAPRAGTDSVRLAPEERDLGVVFTAPTSLQPRAVQFRYRVVGLTDDWVEVGARREITYGHLPPGRYTLEVVAANADGTWGGVPARLAVTVVPYFWETRWFAVAGTAAVAALAALLAIVRVRQLQADARRLQAQVDARTAELREANARLAALATTDALTGLANRRRFDEAMRLEVQRAARAAAPLSLLVMDVDDFKKFNDTHGHPAGDACLRAVGGALAGAVRRDTDLAARIGGEEFAVVLPATAEEAARQVAEAIRAAVRALAIAHAASRAASVVTLSVGVATVWPGGDTAPEAVLAAADAALYRAKAAGRDRVAV
jgi:diguanylate cyclase (GGDEF)-like protein